MLAAASPQELYYVVSTFRLQQDMDRQWPAATNLVIAAYRSHLIKLCERFQQMMVDHSDHAQEERPRVASYVDPVVVSVGG